LFTSTSIAPRLCSISATAGAIFAVSVTSRIGAVRAAADRFEFLPVGLVAHGAGDAVASFSAASASARPNPEETR